jgi:hypothetical protein
LAEIDGSKNQGMSRPWKGGSTGLIAITLTLAYPKSSKTSATFESEKFYCCWVIACKQFGADIGTV